MTKYVVATEYGGPEVLRVRDEEVGPPGDGDVLIDVRAAGVNPFDAKLYSGAYGSNPSRLPMRLGNEVAGVVAAVGPAVEAFAAGDEVIAYRVVGGYAERIVTGVKSVVSKPDGLSFEAAAGLLLAGVTAFHAVERMAVRSGDTVLVHGASGGVGRMAVQLARRRGATVVGTTSRGNFAELEGLGAVPVEYGDGLSDRVRAAAPRGVDAAFDIIGTDEAVDVSLDLVADRSRVVTAVASGRAGEDGFVAIGSGPGADPGNELRAAARPELARLAAAGELSVLVSEAFPLADVVKAHEQIRSGHTRGKIVLVP